jgi:hypothetical protein
MRRLAPSPESRRRRPALTVEQVLAWADAHHARTGDWPTRRTGPVADAPGEKWVNVDQALQGGVRGLPGGDTLARLLDRHRRDGSPSARVWGPEEDWLVRALPPAEAALRTGRTLLAVYKRRSRLGIRPPGRRG